MSGMTREKWKLTQAAIGEPKIDAWGTDEDLTLGFSMMKALAESEDTLVEVEPGVWRHFVSTLDVIFEGYTEEDGVEKLRPGVYRVKTDGWL